MSLRCPRCERPTYWPRRTGDVRIKPASLAPGTLEALTMDGTCTTCWRVIKGKVRPSKKGLVNKPPPIARHVITDAEVESVRAELLRLWRDRRRRGIDPEGQDPTSLHRPGLTLVEV